MTSSNGDKPQEQLADEIEREGIERVLYGKGHAEMIALNHALVDALRSGVSSADAGGNGLPTNWPTRLSDCIAASTEFREDVAAGNVGRSAGSAAKVASAFYASSATTALPDDFTEAVTRFAEFDKGPPDKIGLVYMTLQQHDFWTEIVDVFRRRAAVGVQGSKS